MGLMQLFRRKAEPVTEQRSATASGYTSQIIAARESYIAGASGLAELTATVQSCVTLWEGAMALADVTGADLLDRHAMALCGRALALRGEALFLIRDRLVPCADWDLSTRDGTPRAYRVSVSDVSGPRSETVLAQEVLHFRVGADTFTPWAGSAPLRRASLSASLLQEIETALRDVYRDSPMGSKIAHVPEGSAEDMETMRRTFRGKRGSTLIIEGTAQAVAAGMHPNLGKAPDELTPDLSRAQPVELLAAARSAILMAYGVLPGMFNPATTGPMVRECQRHLAGWILQPIAEMMAAECQSKLGASVSIDVGRPLQAFDAGGRARALSQIIEAMGRAKELGLSPEELSAAFKSVNWGGGDSLA